ncbi:hypothetical protein OK18_07975 [Chryseobacterium gallinarum]|uniref:Uncharacterized protein n=2 Tax=Chryseobacterium gallinarum TaxID=1324352 RepID=A0A0G3M3I9_CHRGL|nr:hypothetical protein OK18_07975 [Chryseobacterium gallinarum]
MIIILVLSFIITIPIYSKIPIQLKPLNQSFIIQSGKTALKNLVISPIQSQPINKGQVLIVSDSTANYPEILKLKYFIEKNLNTKTVTKPPQRSASDLGTLKKDYLEYTSGKKSPTEFYKSIIYWEDTHLITSDSKGTLSIEMDDEGGVEYMIYPEKGIDHSIRYLIAELSPDEMNQLKGNHYFLTIVSPRNYQNKKINISLINENYVRNNDKYSVLFRINGTSLEGNNRINGYINILTSNKKVIYLLLPFFDKK